MLFSAFVRISSECSCILGATDKTPFGQNQLTLKGKISMRHIILFFVIVVLVGGLVGCDGNTSAKILIEYRRTGGFLGLDDHLSIDTNGKATIVRKTGQYEYILDGDTMTRLQVLFDDAQFSELDGEYLPSSTGNDLFEYMVKYKGHIVRAMDTAVPESLQPILDMLNQFIEMGG